MSLAPTPIVRLAPLSPRLGDFAVIHDGRLVDAALVAPEEPRLGGNSSLFLQAVTLGSRTSMLVEWPDGSLAYALLPCGVLAQEALCTALREAYARGRHCLEALHLQAGETAGTA